MPIGSPKFHQFLHSGVININGNQEGFAKVTFRPLGMKSFAIFLWGLINVNSYRHDQQSIINILDNRIILSKVCPKECEIIFLCPTSLIIDENKSCAMRNTRGVTKYHLPWHLFYIWSACQRYDKIICMFGWLICEHYLVFMHDFVYMDFLRKLTLSYQQ